MMAERPILFSAPMVRALLAGRKTQTRRPVSKKLTAHHGAPVQFASTPTDPHELLFSSSDPDAAPHVMVTVPFHADQRLWVRETFAHRDREFHPEGCYWYAATDDYEGPSKPSIFMPRAASRIILNVTSVRVERLHDISETDAIAEGVTFDGQWWLGADHPVKGTPKVFPTARQAFASLWDSINAERAPWASNPCLSGCHPEES